MSRLPAWVYDHPEVWTSPHRQGGEPCVRGTRIPVEIILNLIADHPDCSNSEILTYYPSAAEHQIQALRESHMSTPQIIRTVRELKALDPDTWLVSLYEPGETELYGGPWVDYMGDIAVDPDATLPAVVIATGDQVRAARKALEEQA